MARLRFDLSHKIQLQCEYHPHYAFFQRKSCGRGACFNLIFLFFSRRALSCRPWFRSSCLLYGFGNIMTGKVPMSVPDKKSSGFYAGVMNGSAYIGSTISTYGLGLIADKSGWNGTFLSLFAISAISTIVFALFFVVYKLITKKSFSDNRL